MHPASPHAGPASDAPHPFRLIERPGGLVRWPTEAWHGASSTDVVMVVWSAGMRLASTRSKGVVKVGSVRSQYGVNMTEGVQRDAAALMRRLLAEVEAGNLEANEPQAKRLLRRIEGAIAALATTRRIGQHFPIIANVRKNST
jgi:hypothetical protein